MKRLAHISDLHFGRTDRALVATLAEDLAEFGPDLCIVTGDLTQRARAEQFEEARAFLDSLPCPRLVVPGNHDIAPLWRPFARLFDPYARYKRYFSEELDSVYVDDDLLVMGLNSVHPLRWKEGRVTPEQIAWIESCVLRYPNRFHVVAAHHPIADVADRPLRHRVRGARALYNAVDRAGIELLLTGHLHESYNGPAAQKIGRDRSLLLAQASTATSTRLRGYPNGYNRILIDAGHVIVDLRSWDGKRFQSGTLGGYRLAGGRWQTELDLRGESGVLVPPAPAPAPG
jgi:3',5'-cyclic AMP phosphodiesterase CpdA